MKKLLCCAAVLLTLVGVSGSYADGVVELASGAWFFDNTDNILQAAKSEDLVLVGEHTLITGPNGKGAVHIGKESYYECVHGIPSPNKGLINQYTIVMDVRTTFEDRFFALYQTDPENKRDNNCELMNRQRNLGRMPTGRSHIECVEANAWTRIAIVVDNSNGIFDIYVNDDRVLLGIGQPVDGDYALQEKVLLFADDDGDDGPLDVSRVLIFGFPLSAEQILALNKELPVCENGCKPAQVMNVKSPSETVTSKRNAFQFDLPEDCGELLQYRMDWDDGSIGRWSLLLPQFAKLRAHHAYNLPGTQELKVQLRNECGIISDWLPFAQVEVKGPPQVRALTTAYQQDLRQDGITLMWEANCNLPGEVHLGKTKDELAQRVQASTVPSGFDSMIYKATITDLEPGTVYFYEVKLAGQYPMGKGSFRTAPAAFEPFSFCVWSDSQGFCRENPSNRHEPTNSMMKHMGASDANFAVTTGDLAEDGADYKDTRQFFLDRVAKYLGTQKPFFIAWGNHDSYGNSILRKFSDNPSKNREGFGPGNGAFAFSYAQCRFICLDYSSMYSDIDSWLEGELQSPESKNARHRFLFVHVPPYCEIWVDGDALLRKTLVPLMEKYGVEACFSGHTHAYERGFLNNVHYIITGGGSWLDHGETVVKEWPHSIVGGKTPVGSYELGLVNEYVRIIVDEEGWRGECVAFNPDGSEVGVIDTFHNDKP
ncbi:MAG: metallophosphoesterase [Candidatus Hydrogenedentales bacterium]